MEDRQATARILYKNYRGEISWRNIIPLEEKIMATEWHGNDRLILLAYDTDKKDVREFCVDDIIERIDL